MITFSSSNHIPTSRWFVYVSKLQVQCSKACLLESVSVHHYLWIITVCYNDCDIIDLNKLFMYLTLPLSVCLSLSHPPSLLSHSLSLSVCLSLPL